MEDYERGWEAYEKFRPRFFNAKTPAEWEAVRVEYEDFIRQAESDDIEACPGCGCGPGDGLTAGCTDPDGCGYWTALHAEPAPVPTKRAITLEDK